MSIEEKLDEFLTVVKIEPVKAAVAIYAPDWLRLIPLNKGIYTTSADLSDPVNHLFSRALRFNFNKQKRCFELCREGTLDDVFCTLIGWLSAVTERVFGREHRLYRWFRCCVEPTHGYNRHRDVAQLLFQIYSYAAIIDGVVSVKPSLNPQKIAQFKILMVALKDKLAVERGWTDAYVFNRRQHRTSNKLR